MVCSLQALRDMNITWPNILQVITNLDEKLGSRISALEERVHANISRTRVAHEQPTKESAAVGGNLKDEVEANAQQPSTSMPGRRGLTGQVASMFEALSKVSVTVANLQRQVVMDHTRLDDADFDNEAMTQSLQDVISALHREAGVREQQLSRMELRLCDKYKQNEDLYDRIEELRERFECGLRFQPQRCAKQVETDSSIVCTLGGRVGKFSQQVNTSKEDVTQQNGGAMSRVIKRLGEETSVVNPRSADHATSLDTDTDISDKAHVLNDANSSGSNLHPMQVSSVSEELTSACSDVVADPHAHLRGKVRRLVKKFGGNSSTGMAMGGEPPMEAFDESFQNARMTASGGDETNAMLFHSHGATGAYTATPATSRASQQLQQQWPTQKRRQVEPRNIRSRAGDEAALCEGSLPLNPGSHFGMPTIGAAPSETGYASIHGVEQHTRQHWSQISATGSTCCPVGTASSRVGSACSPRGSARRPRSHCDRATRGWTSGISARHCMSADKSGFYGASLAF
jgi:hypothetical protein